MRKFLDGVIVVQPVQSICNTMLRLNVVCTRVIENFPVGSSGEAEETFR